MNLILFGFKGAGKTHFGKKLAIKMNRPFIDTDDLMSETYCQKTSLKKKPREIFKKLGEKEFRLLEKRSLVFLTEIKNAIIATGGGTVLDPENVAFLSNIGELIYLKAGAEKIKKRLFEDELPAFFDPAHPDISFQQMLQQREPIYRSIKARQIDTDLLDEAGVLAALTSILLLEDHGL